MASCGSTTCDKFDPINAQWFKIKQDGLKADGNWTQIELCKRHPQLPLSQGLTAVRFFVVNGGVSSATIPETLAPGNYMVRHEIIALHLATAMGGAEFYEGCVQTRIGGNQTGAPSPSDLVSLPGAYSDSDPGIFDPNVRLLPNLLSF
jgi:hypothetical protein